MFGTFYCEIKTIIIKLKNYSSQVLGSLVSVRVVHKCFNPNPIRW